MIEQRAHRVEVEGKRYLIRAGKPGHDALIHQELPRGKMRLVTDKETIHKIAVAFQEAVTVHKAESAAQQRHETTRRFRIARKIGELWSRFTHWLSRTLTPP